MKLPVYAIVRKDDPAAYLRTTSGHPFQSSSKIFIKNLFGDYIATRMIIYHQAAEILIFLKSNSLKK